MRTPTIQTEDELREMFWREFPQLDREKIRDYSGNGLMYRTDTRCAWVDWIDMLCKDGQISSELAHSATLDD